MMPGYGMMPGLQFDPVASSVFLGPSAVLTPRHCHSAKRLVFHLVPATDYKGYWSVLPPAVVVGVYPLGKGPVFQPGALQQSLH